MHHHRGCPCRWAWLLALGLAVAATLLSGGAGAIEVSTIEVFPTRLTLDGPRDARRVLVTGIAADGTRSRPDGRGDLRGRAAMPLPSTPPGSSTARRTGRLR